MKKIDAVRQRGRGIIALIGIVLALVLTWTFSDRIWHWADAAMGNRPLLAAKSWHYHLMDLDRERMAQSKADVIVTEYSSSQGQRTAWKPDEISALKTRPNKRPRIVLSYFSIGEAESYRFYWRPEWTGDNLPDWYVAENCAWPRNFMVRFWLDSWKDIIYRGEDSFLNRIVKAGFDGVYLDRIDVFWEQLKERPTARADMIQFVSEIAAKGRQLKPGFLVVAQNAEDLVVDRVYRNIIDGLGKEDLLFGHKGTGVRNPKSSIAESLSQIRYLQEDFKPVLAVEYLSKPAQISAARAELEGYGMVPTFAHRSLDGLDPTAVRPVTTIKYGTPEWIAAECNGKRHW